MCTSNLRFFVCKECGPKGLHAKLQSLKDRLSQEGIQIELYNSICLSACKFNRVVKIQLPDGSLLSYSDRDVNGFRKWVDEPMVQITAECLSQLEATALKNQSTQLQPQ